MQFRLSAYEQATQYEHRCQHGAGPITVTPHFVGAALAKFVFQNVADYTAKQIKSQEEVATPLDKQLNMQTINYEQIWEILFERIQSLGSNKRSEVRKTAVITLENIIMTHGSSFQASLAWPKVLNDTVLGMLKNAIDRYSQTS